MLWQVDALFLSHIGSLFAAEGLHSCLWPDTTRFNGSRVPSTIYSLFFKILKIHNLQKDKKKLNFSKKKHFSKKISIFSKTIYNVRVKQLAGSSLRCNRAQRDTTILSRVPAWSVSCSGLQTLSLTAAATLPTPPPSPKRRLVGGSVI